MLIVHCMVHMATRRQWCGTSGFIHACTIWWTPSPQKLQHVSSQHLLQH
jgi:hypothetical protein